MGNLRKIRIGTDIITMLSVNISGNPVTWSDKDIRHVFAFSDVQGQPVAEMAFKSEGQSLRCTYAAKDQNYIGAFRIIIEFADGTSFASSLDVPAFEIVRTTEEADADTGAVVLDIDGTMRFYSLSEAIAKIEAATAAANQAASTANTAASNANEKANLAQQAADNANKAKENTDRTNEDAQKAELERSKAEAKRLSAETARKNAENERQASETTREQNEEARASAENERLTDERARAQKELERQGNETRRQAAERARVNAESSRSEAEKTRESSEIARKDAETKRASAETGRVDAEKQRVTEFSRLKSESETATDNAVKAADRANKAAAAADISAISNAVAEHTEKITKIEQLQQEGYAFMGVATPETNPSTPDQKVFYIANGKGTYTKFGGIEVVENEAVILYYDTVWHKVATGIASEADAILGMAHGDKVNVPLEFVANGFLDKNGTVSTSSGSKVTDFIAIDSHNKYYLSNQIYADYDNGVCYYSDANEDSFIGSQFNANDLDNSGTTILEEAELNIPTNARYIRIGTRCITYTNAIVLLVRYTQESVSMFNAKRIESRLNQQEITINALYPYIEHSDSVNIFNKNNIEIIHKYITTKKVIIDNNPSELASLIIKIEDCDRVNNTYILKYLGTSDVMAMGLNAVRLIFANNIIAGEDVVWDYSEVSQINGIQGYSTNTGKSSVYLWVYFKLESINFDNVKNVLQDILDNIVIIKQASTDIVYPTEYVPYTDKKFVVKNDEPIPTDLTSNSAGGIVSLGMVDKNGHAIGQGVTFNVGGGGGLEADQLNVITSITYKLQPSVLPSETLVLGAGWDGSIDSGFTHTAGTTDALEFTMTSVPNLAKLLITFDVQGLSESNDVYVSAGESALIKSYNGGTQIVAGLIYAGGNLKVTPTSIFAGTITNLKCRVLDDNGTETYTTLVDNVYCRRNSLVAGYWNVFIGGKTNTASRMQDGTRNIAIGREALNRMVVGNRNVAIGTYSMPQVTEGENNIAIGSDSLYPVEKAMNSVSIGKATMSGKSVENCVALGYGAMGLWNFEFIRNGCTAIGALSAVGVIKGNTHVGYRAGANTKGAYNTSIGYNSLGIGTRSSIDIVGDNLTCVGHDASVANNDTAKAANNSTAIGYGATITKSNQVVIGNKQVEEVILGGKKIIFNADGTCTWEAV